jgi:hypothetical protein
MPDASDICDTLPVRRFRILAVAACLLAGAPLPAWAEPSPAASARATPSPTSAETVCEISDPRATELSGLVTTDAGYVAINDSQDAPGAMRIFFFERTCALTRTIGYPTTPRDPEDLAIAPDGTLWVADIGDNVTNAPNNRRQTIALWKLPAGGKTPVLHRLAYPDGPHDAEALILDGDGTPVIVTKSISGSTALYTPTGPLQPNTATAVPLRKAGTITPEITATENLLGIAGRMVVTGGANSPDGKRVALRTYADAYEWDVPDGDVVKAITTGKPRITPLPGEPQGESIAYTRDGANLLTVSDVNGPTPLLRYRPVKPSPSARPATSPAAAADGRQLVNWLSLDRVLLLVGATAVLGLGLVAVGLLGLRRSRRARRPAGKRGRVEAGGSYPHAGSKPGSN